MSIAVDSPDRFSRVSRALLAFVGQAALWIVLWLGLIYFPQPASAGLDPSWRMALNYAVEHRLQYGVDLVFTYGPLGYLLPATNSGAIYPHHLVWQLGANAIFATVIWLYGRSLRGWRLAAYYYFFLAFGVTYGDAVHMIMIMLPAMALLRDPVARRRWLVGLIGLLLAVLALVKFTNFMLAGFAVACVCGHHLWRRRWLDLGLVAGTFVAGYLAGWVLWGQHIANLPAYIVNSLSVSSGYGEGMAVYETPAVFFLGLGAALGVAAYYLLTLWRRRDFPRALALMLIAAATSFINWKHGYIRADGHVFAHYISCLLLAVTYPFLLQDDGPWPRLKGAVLGFAAICSLIAAHIVSPYAITDAAATWNYHVKATVNSLLILPDLTRNARQEYANISKTNSLPGLKAWVGNERVDMLGNEQAYLMFSGLDYAPRPVLQSYSTYTNRLLRLNEEFYRSPRAPKYVAQKVDTIDYRLPVLDDSLATRYVYHHYSFLTNEAGFLVWRRNPPDPSLDEQVPLSSARLAFGQAIKVPEHGEDPIWAEVEVRASLLGSLRAFLYKAPLVMMKLTDRGNNQNNYRLIREMARTGFLLYPYLANNDAVERFEKDEPPVRVDSFSVEVPPAQQKYFRPDIAVRFYRLKPFPRADVAATEQLSEKKFRMFDRAPAAASAMYPITALTEDNYEVMSAHPPSTMEFNVDFPATRVTGRFGLAAKAYQPPNQTDGVDFILEWIAADGGNTKLFGRLLRPSTVADDRGFQSFDVALPQGGGRLILRTTPGPNNDLSYDWAFWTDLKFNK